MADWKPIGTAPKDGSRILAFGKIGFETGEGVATVAWSRDCNCWWSDPSEATEYVPEACQLSHWMELPKPPNH